MLLTPNKQKRESARGVRRPRCAGFAILQLLSIFKKWRRIAPRMIGTRILRSGGMDSIPSSWKMEIMDFSEKKILKMKTDFILLLRDVSKSVELNSKFDENGKFISPSKEEGRMIHKLRKSMLKAHLIAQKLKSIDRFKDLKFLLDDVDPIIVTYYCKFDYPNNSEIYIPILFKHLQECPRGMYTIEISQALKEFGALKSEIDKTLEDRALKFDSRI